MRCLACNKGLNSRESTRKYASSGTYIDLCDRCFSYVAEEIPDVSDGIDPDQFDDDTDNESIDGNEFEREEGLSTGADGEDDGQE